MNYLVNSFIKYQQNHGWNLPDKKSLLAVSGGLDSMVMAHVFLELEYDFEIAHCNFTLRGAESDQDETFIKDHFSRYGIPFHSKTFDTKNFAEEQKLSTQEAARKLRYDWFDQLVTELSFDFIITAHHSNDSVETVIYNFTKGTGIDGLTGIPIQNGNIIRPLLFATRLELEQFAFEKNISYRVDSSNEETKYSRNKIRLGVIPVLKEINPAFDEVAAANIERLIETAGIFREAIENKKLYLVSHVDQQILIDWQLLNKERFSKTILFELIKEFGFNSHQVAQILESTLGHSGKMFYSSSHSLELGRSHLIICKNEREGPEAYLIQSEEEEVNLKPGTLCQKIIAAEEISFTNNESIAYLDKNSLTFPLLLRKWKAGDSFQPLGMNGRHQSLQDYFTHQKFSRTKKKSIWILESNGKIAWVVGHRIDERFKISEQTKEAVQFSLKE